MPRIDNGRFVYNEDDGRDSGAFGMDPRPSKGIGDDESKTTPRDRRAALGEATGVTHRNVDLRRASWGVAVPASSGGMVQSGETVYYGHALQIVAGTTLSPGDALALVGADGRALRWLSPGTDQASAPGDGVLVRDLAIAVVTLGTGRFTFRLPAGWAVYGTVVIGAME